MSESQECRVEDAVRRVLNGDRQAFIIIVEAFQQPIFTYCWRMLNNRQEAEDAVQEVLVKAFQKLHTYRPDTSLQAWLYKMAYHHCLNILRRARLLQKLALWPVADHELSSSAEEEAEKQIFSEPLEKALHNLSIEERNLIVLRIFEERTFAEIGRILNKTEDAVKKRYQRALAKMKKQMTESEEDPLWAITGLGWKKS